MKTRVLTALALIPVVLGVVFCTSPWPIGVLLLVVTGLAAFEAAKVSGAIGAAVILGALAFAFVGTEQLILHPTTPVVIWAEMAVAWTVLGLLSARYGKPSVFGLLIGGWIGGPIIALFLLHHLGALGFTDLFIFKTPVLLALLPLWGGDTAAIFAGKAFGKHLMAPAISPKKTWEGGIANLIVCVAVAIPLAIWIGYAPWVGIACGLSAGILGQAGDLFESSLKRRANLKDSGSLLPGHGGILDRIDSLLFTAPAVALIVAIASR